MQQTVHYSLNKPDPNDTYNKANDNANMDAIDAQMYANAQAAATAQSTANQALSAAENISAATPTDPGTVAVSAPPANGQNPVAVATTDAKYVNGAQLNVAQTWTANQTLAPTGTATSSQNFPSYEWQFQRSVYSGGAAITDTSYLYKDASGTFHYINGSGASIWQIDSNGNYTMPNGMSIQASGGAQLFSSASGGSWSVKSMTGAAVSFTVENSNGAIGLQVGNGTNPSTTTFKNTLDDGTGVFSNNPSIQSLAGTSAGTIYWVEDMQGTIRRVWIRFQGYENNTSTNQTITLPNGFNYEPFIGTNGTTPTMAVTENIVTITAPNSTTIYNGTIVLIGN